MLKTPLEKVGFLFNGVFINKKLKNYEKNYFKYYYVNYVI